MESSSIENRHTIDIQYYCTPNGRRPFIEWFETVRDKITQNKIDKRLERLEEGNFGDCQSVGGGVFELRLHFGPGYRIYFGQIRNKLVVLLCGGDKASQARDIERAKTYWKEYKETQR